MNRTIKATISGSHLSDIDFWPVEREPIYARIVKDIADDMRAYCNDTETGLADFLEAAIQRELDFRAGEKRFDIKKLLTKEAAKK